MFEMFLTILAAGAAAVYGVSKSVFMNGPYQRYYRIGLAVVLIIFFLFWSLRRTIKYANIRDLNVDLEDYLYYDKFTTILYTIGYFLSYLIQNVLFDYTYMKRNFNFCKGLDVYDDGVSEYYIKFRNTWYKYLQLTLKRHSISMRKLKSFAADMKNEMIFKAYKTDEERMVCLAYEKILKEYYQENKKMSKPIMKMFPLYKEVNKYYFHNLFIHYKMAMYIEKHEPEVVDLVNLQNFRAKRDVNDFKKMKMKE